MQHGSSVVIVLPALVLSMHAPAHGFAATAARGLAAGADPSRMSPRAPAVRMTAAGQEPAVVEASLGLDRPARRLIQQGLRNEGFDPGAPTGCSAPARGPPSSTGRRRVASRAAAI